MNIATTLDGADLSGNQSHVTAGLKTIDPRAIDPNRGLPVGVGESQKLQSRESCTPMKILLAKDTTLLCNTHFKDFFEFFEIAEKTGFSNCKPFAVSSPHGKGGACEVKTCFCHCCCCKSENCAVLNVTKCERCDMRGNAHCFHHEAGDERTAARISAELTLLCEIHSHSMAR